MDISGHKRITEAFVIFIAEELNRVNKLAGYGEIPIHKDALLLGQWLSDVSQVMNMAYLAQEYLSEKAEHVGALKVEIRRAVNLLRAPLKKALKHGKSSADELVRDIFETVRRWRTDMVQQVSWLDHEIKRAGQLDPIDTAKIGLINEPIDTELFPTGVPRQLLENYTPLSEDIQALLKKHKVLDDEVFERCYELIAQWFTDNLRTVQSLPGGVELPRSLAELLEDLSLARYFSEFHVDQLLDRCIEEIESFIDEYIVRVTRAPVAKADFNYVNYDHHPPMVQLIMNFIALYGFMSFAVPQRSEKGKLGHGISEKTYERIIGKHIRYSPSYLHMDRPREPELADLEFDASGEEPPTLYPYLVQQRERLVERLYALERDGFAALSNCGALGLGQPSDLATNDQLALLYADFGEILHTVQDFFAHSNFTEHAVSVSKSRDLLDKYPLRELHATYGVEPLNTGPIPDYHVGTYLNRRLISLNQLLAVQKDPFQAYDELHQGFHSLRQEHNFIGAYQQAGKHHERHVVTGFVPFAEFSYILVDWVLSAVVGVLGVEHRASIAETGRRAADSLLAVRREPTEFFSRLFADVVDGIRHPGREAKDPSNILKDSLWEPLHEFFEGYKSLADFEPPESLRDTLGTYKKGKKFLDGLRKLQKTLPFISSLIQLLRLIIRLQIAKKRGGDLTTLTRAVRRSRRGLVKLIKPGPIWFAQKGVEWIVFPEVMNAIKEKLNAARIGSHGLLAKDGHDSPFYPEASLLAGHVSSAVTLALFRAEIRREQQSSLDMQFPDWKELIEFFLAHPVEGRVMVESLETHFRAPEFVITNRHAELNSLASISQAYAGRVDMPDEVLRSYRLKRNPVVPPWQLIADANFGTWGMNDKDREDVVNHILGISGSGYKVDAVNFAFNSGLRIEVPFVSQRYREYSVVFDEEPWWLKPLRDLRTGTLSDIKEAIAVQRGAAASKEAKDESRPAEGPRIGDVLGYRFQYTNRYGNLQASVDATRTVHKAFRDAHGDLEDLEAARRKEMLSFVEQSRRAGRTLSRSVA